MQSGRDMTEKTRVPASPYSFPVRKFAVYGVFPHCFLKNLHISDSSLIKNKCFLTGIIGFTTCVWEGDSEDPCDRLRLKLRVVDVFFEEDGK